MEIIEIRSAHSLVAPKPELRPLGAHSYQVNCRQFAYLYKSWHKSHAAPLDLLGLMTLASDRIWITEAEGEQIASAIQLAHSPVALA